MATSGELAKLLSKILNIPLGTVQYYGQALRDAEMLSKGGRGRSAVQMTSIDAAVWLISLCTATVAEAAPGITKIVLSFVPALTEMSQADRELIKDGSVEIPVFSRTDVLAGEGDWLASYGVLSVELADLGSFVATLIHGFRTEKLYPSSDKVLFAHFEFGAFEGSASFFFKAPKAGPEEILLPVQVDFFDTRLLEGRPSRLYTRRRHRREGPRKLSLLSRINRLDLDALGFIAALLDGVPNGGAAE